MSAERYAIIDIETTGGRADLHRITEIAIILHDGEHILDTYETKGFSFLKDVFNDPKVLEQTTGLDKLLESATADGFDEWEEDDDVVETDNQDFLAEATEESDM